MKKIILASSSPRRKQVLEQVGLNFTVEVSDYEEKPISGVKPHEFVETLSFGKAKAVAKNHEDAIIIGADTIVVLNNQILGKPKTKEDARGMLKKLSGNTHSVFTGFTIIDTKNNKTITNHVETKIRFRNLSGKEISKYVETEEPMDKAGAYGVQDRGALFVEYIEGDYSSVMGLPILKIFEVLKTLGIDTLKTYEKK
ncbi:MAG: Maf family protein [Patescibacteria group bacterium]|nr:Maf family protein [Patescibacteria group bacterium]